jgi:hypothetical protein
MYRKFQTKYSSKTGQKTSASMTLKGAIKAAIVRVALREYTEATIYYDEEIVAWVYTNGRGQTGLRVLKMNLLKG